MSNQNSTTILSNLPIRPSTPWLAPLAGFSDLPFRLLCREFGCQVACTEMVSAKGLLYRSQGTIEILRTCPQDNPLVVQLYGSEPDTLARATENLLEQGFKYFDLNCGCSVKKVVKTGSGAALLKAPDLLVSIVKEMVKLAAPGCVGVKLRLGWSKNEPVYIDLARRLEAIGVGWITLHPRFAKQGFSGQADWLALKKLKASVKIPIIGSGDLFTAHDGLDCLELTRIDGIMFARGALYDPSIFLRYTCLIEKQKAPPKDGHFLAAMILKMARLYQKIDSSPRALLKMRTLVPKMIRDLPGARFLRNELTHCSSWSHLEEILNRLRLLGYA
ncbi:tRNA-dihydrouridine synthase family protein [Desulfohalobiaceae bacterium Ax17]|uniref:tRNA dihydrouridine synthase n=1 Tax=Desulfovulcanus ferrireducens TaxID=2831190 RepID=UPI00207BB00C|nr:tRNA-dihydrouridine synthase family protein [Desulfovulcanus ferrireducens]MBT8764411.1 tRNA-dihydrouridine synthase family protein [Desulfovulcanus ferrireducens]